MGALVLVLIVVVAGVVLIRQYVRGDCAYRSLGEATKHYIEEEMRRSARS